MRSESPSTGASIWWNIYTRIGEEVWHEKIYRTCCHYTNCNKKHQNIESTGSLTPFIYSLLLPLFFMPLLFKYHSTPICFVILLIYKKLFDIKSIKRIIPIKNVYNFIELDVRATMNRFAVKFFVFVSFKVLECNMLKLRRRTCYSIPQITNRFPAVIWKHSLPRLRFLSYDSVQQVSVTRCFNIFHDHVLQGWEILLAWLFSVFILHEEQKFGEFRQWLGSMASIVKVEYTNW